ncbi:MAG: NUDIX hydrolase [Rhodocyclaceae bacterium]|nr:NUDIX hydrolase [Rhodocyclaceae bacterium]MCA3021452.1 NUDIX hydrolase [Rhodocyclaceae bacterium]MCA3028402.1 NUDIX hydrolase [Rhodocyclaceae bacterium]MCA3044005.1 NUDIX hydrolase [Rhodocyclaceae bacterium]MCA3054200.1 NUDIX hydrolase [Rhodocyclaceae bacterium]
MSLSTPKTISNAQPDFERPSTTVDVVMFAVRDGRLHVLLVKRADAPGEPFPGHWALPGGYIDVSKDDSLEACALRKLKEKTGVVSPYLEQLGSWGSKTRDPRGWHSTHAYFALLPAASVITPVSGANAAEADWVPIASKGVVHKLAFDHQVILEAAVERLRNKVEYTSLPAFLLPETFTLTELQTAFETVLGRALDKSSFRKRVEDAELVVALKNKFREGSNRPAQIYKLRSKTAPVFFPRAISETKSRPVKSTAKVRRTSESNF